MAKKTTFKYECHVTAHNQPNIYVRINKREGKYLTTCPIYMTIDRPAYCDLLIQVSTF